MEMEEATIKFALQRLAGHLLCLRRRLVYQLRRHPTAEASLTSRADVVA